MNPICEKCYSRNTHPMTGSSTFFPQSLNQTLFSPSVLASIGASICRYYRVNPAIGVMTGVVLGGAISLVQEHQRFKQLGFKQSMFYCQNCHHVFQKRDDVVKTATDFADFKEV